MGFFDKIKSGLKKTREILFMDVKDVFRIGRKVDEALLGELEERLILADVGPRLAADIEGSAAVDEALAVATLVALADGELAGPEYAALMELGELLGFEATRVRSRIDEVVGGLVRRLEANR